MSGKVRDDSPDGLADDGPDFEFEVSDSGIFEQVTIRDPETGRETTFLQRPRLELPEGFKVRHDEGRAAIGVGVEGVLEGVELLLPYRWGPRDNVEIQHTTVDAALFCAEVVKRSREASREKLTAREREAFEAILALERLSGRAKVALGRGGEDAETFREATLDAFLAGVMYGKAWAREREREAEIGGKVRHTAREASQSRRFDPERIRGIVALVMERQPGSQRKAVIDEAARLADCSTRTIRRRAGDLLPPKRRYRRYRPKSNLTDL